MIKSIAKSVVAFLLGFIGLVNGEPARADVTDDAFDFSPSCSEKHFYRYAPVVAFKSDERKRLSIENIVQNCDSNFAGDRIFLYALQVIEGELKPEADTDPSDDRIVYSYGLLIAASYYEAGPKVAFDIDKSRELYLQSALRGNATALDEFLNSTIRSGVSFRTAETQRAVDAIINFYPINCVRLYSAFTRVFHVRPEEIGNDVRFVRLKDSMTEKLNLRCADWVDYFQRVYGEDPVPALTHLLEHQ